MKCYPACFGNGHTTQRTPTAGQAIFEKADCPVFKHPRHLKTPNLIVSLSPSLTTNAIVTRLPARISDRCDSREGSVEDDEEAPHPAGNERQGADRPLVFREEVLILQGRSLASRCLTRGKQI